jgi:hypothetical protein
MLLDAFFGTGGRALWDLMVGRVLGWLDTPLPYALILAYQLALIATALVDSRADVRIGARAKLVAAVALLAGLAGIGTLLYTQGHAVGVGYIAEIQGRYLIPLSPLPLLLLYNRSLRALVSARIPRGLPAAGAGRATLVAFLLLSSALTCAVIARRYYLQ